MSDAKPPQERPSPGAEAARNARRGNPSQDVLEWLHCTHHGTLSTLNVRAEAEGYPTGSVVPFALDGEGRPFILIASIAAHTKNLKRDSRASLFVHDGAATGDPQTSWRVSIIGRLRQLTTREDAGEDCEEISADEYEDLLARYLERVPKAGSYLKTHGFHFWRFSELKSIRYIAGFGRICWIPGDEYLQLAGPETFAEMRAGALAHMNEDHAENMREICRGLLDLTVESAEMASLDLTGCLLKTHGPEGYRYTSFEQVCTEADHFKKEIIGLLRRSRQQLRQAAAEG